jgi:ketosteroid isomerase-like protein
MSDRERNKAAARAVFEVWSTGDLDRLDALVSLDVVHHDPYDPHALERLAGMKRTIAKSRGLTPDLVLTVEDQIAEADKVATRWTASMTRDGKRLTLKGITLDRFEHGRIVEAWRCMDRLRLLQQSGRTP